MAGNCYLDESIAGCSYEATDPELVISSEQAENADFCKKRCLAHPDCSKTIFRTISPEIRVCVYLKDICGVSSKPEDSGLFFNCSKKTGLFKYNIKISF